MEEKMKKCPACAENIKFEAKKCRYCGEIFEEIKEDNKLKDNKLFVHLWEFVLLIRPKIKCKNCKNIGNPGISDIKYQNLIFSLGFFGNLFLLYYLGTSFGMIGGALAILISFFISKLFDSYFQKLGMYFICKKCGSSNIEKIKK